jgi:hypothetical protein
MSKDGNFTLLQEALDDITYRKLLKHQAEFDSTKSHGISYFTIKVTVDRTTLLENLQISLGKRICLISPLFTLNHVANA